MSFFSISPSLLGLPYSFPCGSRACQSQSVDCPGGQLGGEGQWQGAGQCPGGQPSHHLLPGGLPTLTLGRSGASSWASLTLSSGPTPLGRQKLTLGRGEGVCDLKPFCGYHLDSQNRGLTVTPQGQKRLKKLTHSQFLLRQG